MCESLEESAVGIGSQGRLVAVVDDDPRICQSLESMLQAAGFTAAVFSSANDFLQSDSLAESACLIADVRLPQMDGLELQRRLKVQRPGMHVILITAHRDENSRRLGLEQGALCFLHKPFDPEELLAAVDRAVSELPRSG
jgi:FixJ family two-component response regulator